MKRLPARQLDLATLWLRLLSLALMGYACLGRGFAHIGYASVYTGEILLLLGFVVVCLRRNPSVPAHIAVVWLWATFAFWGLVRSLPYFARYGYDVMRDAVVWGYGLFALFIIIFTLEDYRAPKVIQGMMPWMRCFLIVIPVPLLLFYVFNITLPIPFFPSVSLFDVRRGDTAVYLAAIVAFVLTGLGSQPRKHPHPLTPLTNVLCAIGFIVSALIVISASRGAFMALLLSLATVAILRPSARLILAGAIALVLAIVVACANPTIKLSTGRQISSSQVVENVTSTFSHTSGDVEMEEARQWRIDWWHSIIHYTIDGPYFWLGKGFGVDLASDDGFAVSKDDQTRSPHDACLNILARTGVVGLCLWILLQGAFVILVFRGYLAARRYGAEWWISVNVWLLATWVAFTVNMAFDVYLESPQGGIPFWSFIGLGVALAFTQDTSYGTRFRAARPSSRPPHYRKPIGARMTCPHSSNRINIA